MSGSHPHKIREFSGVPWLYSALNSGGAILHHIQIIVSLAYLCQVNFNIDAMLILYLIRLTFDNNNQVDLFPNETVLKEIATAGGGTYFWFANLIKKN